ncbi:unnamed protein product [Amoebophrya sp. A25]|nr:unnamed protein product [Amoebophrya sp. A25]|eukprot:GSA25T00003394001.1
MKTLSEHFYPEWLERVTTALSKTKGELTRDGCWRVVCDNTCLWEKYSFPTVMSNRQAGVSYDSCNQWGTAQFFRPNEELISGATFVARVLYAAKMYGTEIEIQNKAIQLQDYDDFEDVLWFTEPALLEAIQKKWGKDEDGFDPEDFHAGLKKMQPKVKTYWIEVKGRATMGGKITEFGVKTLFGIEQKMGTRPTEAEKRQQLKMRMRGGEFCRRLERAKAEAEWEFIEKYNAKIRSHLEKDESLYNWNEMFNKQQDAFWTRTEKEKAANAEKGNSDWLYKVGKE